MVHGEGVSIENSQWFQQGDNKEKKFSRKTPSKVRENGKQLSIQFWCSLEEARSPLFIELRHTGF